MDWQGNQNPSSDVSLCCNEWAIPLVEAFQAESPIEPSLVADFAILSRVGAYPAPEPGGHVRHYPAITLVTVFLARRRIAVPTMPRPPIISVQVIGSGTPARIATCAVEKL